MKLYEVVKMLDDLGFSETLCDCLLKRLKGDDSVLSTLETSRDLAKLLRKEDLMPRKIDRNAVRYIEWAAARDDAESFARFLERNGIEGKLHDILLIQFRKRDPEIVRSVCAQDLKSYLEKHGDSLPDNIFDDICNFLEQREEAWFKDPDSLRAYILSFGIEAKLCANAISFHMRGNPDGDISEAIFPRRSGPAKMKKNSRKRCLFTAPKSRAWVRQGQI